jgi:hypothetical protein
MDNLSAHISGARVAPPPANIRIQWLPANSTSRYQPLDQGIINNLKHYYKKQWLEFIIEQYERQQDPYQLMNLSFTVRWLPRAWFTNVSNDTIYRCFRKAKIQPQQESIALPPEPQPDLTSLYRTVQRVGNIREMMSIEAFLNPLGEDEPPEEDRGLASEQEVDLDILI